MSESSSPSLGQPAVFLDRDGTINREVDYLARVEDFEFLPGAVEGLRDLAMAGFALVVVTNQSGIARGLLDEARLAEIHAHMEAALAAEGVHLDWIGHCPHHPGHGQAPYRAVCSCRKPQPGMLLSAAAALHLDLRTSFCVGDSLRDLQAAAAVGVPGVLVRTGKGASQEKEIEAGRFRGLKSEVPVVDDLGAAARYILGHDNR